MYGLKDSNSVLCYISVQVICCFMIYQKYVLLILSS